MTLLTHDDRASRESSVTWADVRERALLLAVLAIATGFRIHNLDSRPLSDAERFNLAHCEPRDWPGFLRHVTDTDLLPPAYPWVLCEARAWFGGSDLVARLPSVLAGILLVYVVYRIGRDLLSPATGLLAAACLAVAYLPVRSSQEALYPSVLSCAGVGVLWFMARIQCRPRRPEETWRHVEIGPTSFSRIVWSWQPPLAVTPGDLAGFWISAVVFFYTGATSWIFLLLAFVCSLAISTARPPSAGRDLMKWMWAPVAVACLPWLPFLARQMEFVLLLSPTVTSLPSRIVPLQAEILGVAVPSPFLLGAIAMVATAIFRMSRAGAEEQPRLMLRLCVTYTLGSTLLFVGFYLYDVHLFVPFLALLTLLAMHGVQIVADALGKYKPVAVAAVLVAVVAWGGMQTASALAVGAAAIDSDTQARPEG